MKNIGVFCSASEQIDPIYQQSAKTLGEWLGHHEKTLIFGGVNRGLMEVIARATQSTGGEVIGVIPKILLSHASKHVDRYITVSDLSQRKDVILEKSDVLIALPGGIGTLDEVFHVLAQRTLNYHSKKVIFYNPNHFFDQLLDTLYFFQQEGFIRNKLADLYAVAKTEADLNTLLK